MKTLLKILAVSLFVFSKCFAQGVMTIKTDKSNYSYGDSIQVSMTISNNSDSTITLWGGSCMVSITFDTLQFKKPCTTSAFPHKITPGSARTWTWELVPSVLGIPTQNGIQTIYVYCLGNNESDSIKITEPKYYGGLMQVGYKSGTSQNKIQNLRDSLNATVIYSTLSNGTIEEEWEIKGYSIDSLANVYSKDTLLQYIEVERQIGEPKETVTDVRPIITAPPIKYKLYQNYPNPFNPTTTIKYSIPKESLVTLKIYDLLGRELETMVDKEESAGDYKVKFDADEYSSGIYFYVLHVANYIETKKLMLIK